MPKARMQKAMPDSNHHNRQRVCKRTPSVVVRPARITTKGRPKRSVPCCYVIFKYLALMNEANKQTNKAHPNSFSNNQKRRLFYSPSPSFLSFFVAQIGSFSHPVKKPIRWIGRCLYFSINWKISSLSLLLELTASQR